MTKRKTTCFEVKDKRALLDATVKESFRSFCERAFETVSGEQLSNDPYIEVICSSLQKVTTGKVKRLIVNLPPRHAKTLLATVCLAAWELAQHPQRRVMIVCYGEDLATNIAHYVRQIIRASWFERIFECRLAPDRNRVADFSTTQGGELLAGSIDGQIQGRGADLIIVDDANRIDKAHSAELLEKVNSRFDTVVASRLNSPNIGRIVIVAHRTHENDLSGHLLKMVGWELLALPFIADAASQHGYWRRRPGELLRADAYSEGEVARIRALPEFEILYQQCLVTSSWLIEADDFASFRTPRNDVATVLSVDTAQGVGDRRSFSVIQVWQTAVDHHYLLDQWMDRVEYRDLLQNVRRLVKSFRPSAVLIEDTGVGTALISDVRAGSPGYRIRVEGISPGCKSKVVRLQKVIETIKAKNVHLPELALWRPSFLDAVTGFPHSGADDVVDAMTQYLEWASQNPALPIPPDRHMGVGRNARNFTINDGLRYPSGATRYVFCRR